jgi:hypothetical protein
MSLIGNVIAMAFNGNPSLINFDMFVAVFAMLSLFYLILIAFNESFTGHPIFPVVIDLLNVLFLFVAAVATAAELKVHSCSNDVGAPPCPTPSTITDLCNRVTLFITTSPMAHTIERAAAVNCKPPPPSSGSHSLFGPSAWPSL